jgi:hypothetical protein
MIESSFSESINSGVEGSYPITKIFTFLRRSIFVNKRSQGLYKKKLGMKDQLLELICSRGCSSVCLASLPTLSAPEKGIFRPDFAMIAGLEVVSVLASENW